MALSLMSAAMCWAGALAQEVAVEDVAESELRVVLEERLPARWFSADTNAYKLRPERWRRRMPPQCRTQGGYIQHCQGERRVAIATPEAAALIVCSHPR